MTHRDRYAAVADFRVLCNASPGGSLSGLAIPAGGGKPCGVALVAGEHLVALAEAVDFSAEAAQHGARHGWCHFAVGGFGQASALADGVELRCLSSGRPLAWWDSAALASGLDAGRRTPIRLEQLLGRVRKLGASTDMRQVLPFGLHLAQNRGTEPFLKATWLYYLERDLVSQELDEWGHLDYTEENAIIEVWSTVMRSPECKMGRSYSRPGPFDVDFPFSRGAFDR